MDNLEICYMSVVQMADAIKTKRLSPVEIMDAVLQRIEWLNPEVNAYCTVVAESARQQAKEAEAGRGGRCSRVGYLFKVRQICLGKLVYLDRQRKECLKYLKN